METFPFFLQDNTTIDWAALTAKECLKYGGQLVGNNCDYVPDITLMSFILFFGTYTCSMALKKFKTSRYFPTTVSISCHPIRLSEGTGQPSFWSCCPTHREGCSSGKPGCTVREKSATSCWIWLSKVCLGFLPVVLESTGKAAEEPRGAITCLGNVSGVLKVLKATLPSLQAHLGCTCLFCPLVWLPGQACEPVLPVCQSHFSLRLLRFWHSDIQGFILHGCLLFHCVTTEPLLFLIKRKQIPSRLECSSIYL